jgi:hypothetical protein
VKLFEESLQKHKLSIQGISNMEKGHLQIFLTNEAKRKTQIQCAFSKMEKYIKRFSMQLATLRVPCRQHIFLHFDLFKKLFKQCEVYDRALTK